MLQRNHEASELPVVFVIETPAACTSARLPHNRMPIITANSTELPQTMSRPIDFRGPQVGTCNICGAYGQLTEDHVPPKGTYRPKAMEVRHLNEAISTWRIGRRYKARDGVKYRSLCRRCNSELLGSKYDPALINFSAKIANMVRFRDTLPDFLSVSGEPQKIMRAVWGHLAAATVDGFGKSGALGELKDWFLDENAVLPQNIKFYYWLYTEQAQVLTRGLGFTLVLNPSRVYFGWLLKFYPVGFLIETNEEQLGIANLGRLSRYRHSGINEIVEIPIPLRPAIHPRFPELYAGENGIVLSGSHAIYSEPRRDR